MLICASLQCIDMLVVTVEALAKKSSCFLFTDLQRFTS